MVEVIDALLSLIPGGSITAIFAAVLAALGWGFHQRLAGAKAERTAHKAKEADAHEQHLKEVAGAHDARNRVDPDRLPDNDPYRRD